MSLFAASDEQHLLADSLRRLLRADHSWRSFADQGIVAGGFSERWGGIAGDARTLAVTMAQIGQARTLEPYLACVIAGRVLERSTDQAAAQQAIAAIVEGRRLYALAHDWRAQAAPSVRLSRSGDAWRASGSVPAVRHGESADELLVPAASDDGRVRILRLARAHPGLSLVPYRSIDGASGASLELHDASVAQSAVLSLDAPAEEVLSDVLAWGVLGLAAETAGIVTALNSATFEYLNTRKQFGTPIGDFQALRHRAADMWINAEELIASVELYAGSFEGLDPSARASLTSAVKVIADATGRKIGNESVQLHGGMGVSDELDVSHYFRRLCAIRAELDGEDGHRLRFSALEADWTVSLLREHSDDMQLFRANVSEFVARRLPSELSAKVSRGLKLHKEDYVRWQKVLHEHGWFAGSWPREFGGQGWDLRRQLAFSQQSALGNAPMVIPYGVNMVGPVLYTFGTPAQCAAHLPGILSSEVWWCQGYSEPGAGSDLASLKTSARRDGDHYVVNGTKMWTTEAHWADMMHCLVRTQQTGKPQQGISFLLIDMRAPGITVRPIVTIDGIHHTNQVFLDQVRVPAENLVGAEGDGWKIAKFLLDHERTSIADTGPKLRLLRRLRALHAETRRKVEPARAALLDARIADLEIQLLALCAVERNYVDAWMGGKKSGSGASLLKVRGTEILQSLTEFAMELEGPLAAIHDPRLVMDAPGGNDDPAHHASVAAYEYLYGRCWSIFGGTNEIQRNIIAREALTR
jgi:alkylation response protein AidB-like acyl-CoA dehydrogenase